MSQADDLQARTDAFADLSLFFVSGLPDTQIARRLSGQYQDSSSSAAANYRAARRARSHAEFTAMLNANIKSTTAAIEPLLKEAEELTRCINGHLHRSIDRLLLSVI